MMKDWVVRALKTFVQAFFGVLIPEIVRLLSNGFPTTISAAWLILSPIVAAALAAAISAVWNITMPPATDKQIKETMTPVQLKELQAALNAEMTRQQDK